MHVGRNAVLCVPSALVGNGSTFLGLPEGQNMVTLYGGTSGNEKILFTNVFVEIPMIIVYLTAIFSSAVTGHWYPCFI